METKKIAVIIPAYNEEDSIQAVVEAVNQIEADNNWQMDAIVVNDCSADTTAKIISTLKCVALNLPVNLGIGGAVQTGFKYAYDNNYDFAIQIDGDGQHPPSEIPKLLKELQDKNLDIVIGSRFISNEGFQSTMMRRTGINYFRLINKIFTGKNITDSTSGFRLLNRKALETVSKYYPDEYPEPEAIVLYSQNNLKIGEVSVVMKERQGGTSSIGSFSSAYYMLKVSLAILFTYMRAPKKKKLCPEFN